MFIPQKQQHQHQSQQYQHLMPTIQKPQNTQQKRNNNSPSIQKMYTQSIQQPQNTNAVVFSTNPLHQNLYHQQQQIDNHVLQQCEQDNQSNTKYEQNSNSNWRNQIPSINIVKPFEKKPEKLYQMKRMVSNILDYSPKPQRQSDVSTNYIPTQDVIPQQQQQQQDSANNTLRKLKAQLQELHQFGFYIYIFIPIAIMQCSFQDTQKRLYQEYHIGYDDMSQFAILFVLLIYNTCLNISLLTSNRINNLRRMLVNLESNYYYSYINSLLYKICKLISLLICRRQLYIEIQKSYNLPFSNQDDQDNYLFGKRSEYLQLMSKNQIFSKTESSGIIQQKTASFPVLDASADEDRLNILQENIKQSKPQSSELDQRVKTQEENIKNYFGLASKPALQNHITLGQQHSQLQLKKVNSSNSSTPTAQFDKFTNFNGSIVQGQEVRFKNRSMEQNNPNFINNDGFEGISSQALSRMNTVQQQQLQTSLFHQQSPILQYVQEGISEKNEDEHSQLSITQGSEQDSQRYYDNIAHNETPKPAYHIQVNDQLIQTSFGKQPVNHTVQINTSAINLINISNNTNNNTQQRKSFKRMQLKDIQKFHTSEYSEAQTQKFSKLLNRTGLDNRRSSIKMGINSKTVPQQHNSMTSNDILIMQKQASKISKFGWQSGNTANNNLSFLDQTEQEESYRGSQLSSSPTFTHGSHKFEIINTDMNILQKRANSETQKPQISQQVLDQQMEEFQITLDTYGALYSIVLYIIMLYLRQQYLETNFLFQFAIYKTFGMLVNRFIKNIKVRYSIFILLFCSLQYSINAEISRCQFYAHIVLNAFFLLAIGPLDQWNTIPEVVTIISNTQNVKMGELMKYKRSDQHLKKIVQLIPYGIAVLNLDDVSHFNNPFGKVLGIKKQTQVLKALNKFQRKIKVDELSSLHQSQNLGFDKVHQSQKSNKSHKKVTFTNLKEDLEYILKNKDVAFKSTDNIFDIYFIDKDETISRQNSQRSARPKSVISSLSATQFDHNQNTATSGRKVYSISISPITWGDKECLLLTVKDITHEKIIDQKQLMDRLKNMIFKSFSHELKTPLNGIMMSLETSSFISKALHSKLKRECQRGQSQMDGFAIQSKQLRMQLKIMESCSYVLKNIMSDFFDYNQLQTNELTLNIKEFDLNKFLKDVSRIVRHQMKFDKVQFRSKIEYQNSGGFLQEKNLSTQNMKMVCDRDRLQQILLNLLMNSIKFTSKGFIELTVYVQQLNTPQIVKFKVKDSGLGIEEDRLPYIFNLFEKNENQNLNQYLNSKNKSARMGLPISQNLCQMMGGHINVKSKVGYGSTFSFRLPLNPNDMVSSRYIDDSLRLNHIGSNNSQSCYTTSKTFEFASLLSNHTQINNGCNSLNNNEIQRSQALLNSSQISQTDLASSINKRRQEKDESSEYSSSESSSINNDEQFIKSSSKDLVFQTNKKLGQFELVFNSPKSKNLNLKLAQAVIYEEEEKTTPKLMHSSTQIDIYNVNNNTSNNNNLAQDKLRRIKTNKVEHDRHLSFNTTSQQLNNLQEISQHIQDRIEEQDDCQSNSQTSSLVSEILDDDSNNKIKSKKSNHKRRSNTQNNDKKEEESKVKTNQKQDYLIGGNQSDYHQSYLKQVRDMNFSFQAKEANKFRQQFQQYSYLRDKNTSTMTEHSANQILQKFDEAVLLKSDEVIQHQQQQPSQQTANAQDGKQNTQNNDNMMNQQKSKMHHEFSFQVQKRKHQLVSLDSFNPQKVNIINSITNTILDPNEEQAEQIRQLLLQSQAQVRVTAQFDQIDMDGPPPIEANDMQRVLQRNSSKNITDKLFNQKQNDMLDKQPIDLNSQRAQSQNQNIMVIDQDQQAFNFDDNIDECTVISERYSSDQVMRQFYTNPGKSMFNLDGNNNNNYAYAGSNHQRSISEDPNMRMNLNRSDMLNLHNYQELIARLVSNQDDLDSPTLDESNIQSVSNILENPTSEETLQLQQHQSQQTLQKQSSLLSTTNNNNNFGNTTNKINKKQPRQHSSSQSHQDSSISRIQFRNSNTSVQHNQNEGGSTNHAFLDPSNFMLFMQKDENRESRGGSGNVVANLPIRDMQQQRNKKQLFKLDSFQSFAAEQSSANRNMEDANDTQKINHSISSNRQTSQKSAFYFSFVPQGSQQNQKLYTSNDQDYCMSILNTRNLNQSEGIDTPDLRGNDDSNYHAAVGYTSFQNIKNDNNNNSNNNNDDENYRDENRAAGFSFNQDRDKVQQTDHINDFEEEKKESQFNGNYSFDNSRTQPASQQNQQINQINSTISQNNVSNTTIPYLQQQSLGINDLISSDQQDNPDSINQKLRIQQQRHDKIYESPKNSKKKKNRPKLVIQTNNLSDNRIIDNLSENTSSCNTANINRFHGSATSNNTTQNNLQNSINNNDSQQPNHKCPQIMVVDDVQLNRYAIEQMLLFIFGIHVIQAENGHECIETLKQFYQDKQCDCQGIRLILMDLEMPVMDGITATVKLKRLMSKPNQTLPEIPIVAITAYHDEKDNCIRAGMKDFMVKPTSKNDLQEMLQKFNIC